MRDKAPWMMTTAAIVYGMGIPSYYVEAAPVHCALFTAAILAVTWVLFRGYRERVIQPSSWGRLATYLGAFLVFDHAANLYCFARIEVPVDFPFVTSGLSLVSWSALLAITTVQVLFTAANAVVLGILMRVLGTPWPWPMALRVAVYSLPASLVIALPGVESWKVGLTGILLVQIFTLGMLLHERRIGPRDPRGS